MLHGVEPFLRKCPTLASQEIRRIYNNTIYLFTAVVLSSGGSGYFTCIQNMNSVTTKFKSGGLHEKHVVATWNLGTISAFAFRHGETKKKLCRGGRSHDLPSTDF